MERWKNNNWQEKNVCQKIKAKMEKIFLIETKYT